MARCAPGHPLVIRNHPVDATGAPFPTLYWLTCREAVKSVARLESDGWIGRLDRRVETDPALRTGLRRAHERYAAERGAAVRGAEAWGGVGGTRTGIKCLHAHLAYHIAGGEDPVGAWVAESVDVRGLHYEKAGRRVAAVDLGTNSTRLLVARLVAGERELRELARDVVITRIGEGVDATGRIQPGALRRTIEVLERYARRARALGADRTRVSATAAVRDAANRDELGRGVMRVTGEPMEVLTGDEEAAVTFLGATRGLVGFPAPYLVLDIGGGSTEVVIGTREPAGAVSVQMGSVRLTERFVRSDPPRSEELAALDAEVQRALSEVEERLPVREAATLVAVGGTPLTIQAIVSGLGEYDPERVHRTVLSRGDAERTFRLLTDMTTEERRRIPVMSPGREDVIPAGAAILVSAMRRLDFREVVVSEADILDGLAYRLDDPSMTATGPP